MTEQVFGPNGNNYGRDPKHPESLALKGFMATIPTAVAMSSFIANNTLMGNRFHDADTNNRNWREDFGHENGNYECWCNDCQKPFFGHKRRITCKACAIPGVADLALIAANMMNQNDYFIAPIRLTTNPTPAQTESLARELLPIIAEVLKRAGVERRP